MLVLRVMRICYESSLHLEISSILKVRCASGVCDQCVRRKPPEKVRRHAGPCWICSHLSNMLLSEFLLKPELSLPLPIAAEL